MDLILWRHAQAEDARGGDDLGRALTPLGHDQAERMAAWLGPRLPPGVRILASPARRCQQTVAALALPATTVEAIAPGASAEALLLATGWPGGTGAVLIVGHQPTLGEAATRALGEPAGGRSIAKGAVCWLRSGAGGSAAEVHALQSPGRL
ncbi:MAG: histidine phosphatase family protein [Caldimonas sp.]